ncbi:D-alanyl-D-alanine carboxypeptidase [Peribacillus saganii]|uniref:serine-type D-Ala-D-Ala carboxypeptidase n=1 Tax=Peribacillus saganii TaxID=2303992 RepID=A0A372LLL3_9BACI|nr:D-alanyl-D-alanine carboxypeptidase family protein [Peribacillus saganii]RFU67795.1 D-alanyl-D-alanine carboxypeptidase [Peribacillus saganii]
MRVLYKWTSIIIAMALLVSLNPHQAKAAIGVSARNAVLMEQDSGRVLYEVNAHEKRRIASITKIMTAILALESGKMDQTVKISDKAIGTEGSALYLQHGQKMKLEDLVYGLMLRSGNDAAVAIAEFVGGSFDGFIWMMNQKAEEIGMKNTNFSNPHGLDNTKDHFSSAYDMALLTRYAMNNEQYKKISGTKKHRAPNSMEGWDYVWRNKNKLLSMYEYCTGGKTGYTKLAKRTLVSTATKDDMSLIAVTLNDGDDWNDHINMYESAFQKYDLTEVLAAGPIKAVKNKVYKGNIYTRTPFLYPLTGEEKEQVTISYKLIQPKKEWSKGKNLPERVGRTEILLDGESIGTRNIFFGKAEATMRMGNEPQWKRIFFTFLGLN